MIALLLVKSLAVRAKWAAYLVVGTSFFYVLSYIVLSLGGGWVVSESGRQRILMLADSDIFEWQPRYAHYHRQISPYSGTLSYGNFLGRFYAPLILADQRWWHKTIPFMVNGESIDPIPAPPLEDYHPLVMNRYMGRWPYEVPILDEDDPEKKTETAGQKSVEP